MQQLGKGRATSKRLYLAVAAMAFFLSGGSLRCAQDTGNNESFLVALLLKTSAIKELAVADLERYDRELEMSEKKFQEAEKRMTNAQETHNDQAIYAAREPLLKARAERNRLRQTRERLDMAIKRADASTAALRDLLISGQSRGGNSLMCGSLSLRSGKATVLKKDGTKAPLKSGRPGFLEPGDEVMTEGESSAEILTFDGRAVVQLGERTQLRLEEDGPQEQVLRLVQGRLYCAVDEAAAFAGILQEQTGKFEADQGLKEAVARSAVRPEGWADNRFTVRTPNACCSVKGTNFTVELIGSGATGISVFSGAVEVGDPDCRKKVRVQQGTRVTMIKTGISEPRELTDADKWWEK